MKTLFFVLALTLIVTIPNTTFAYEKGSHPAQDGINYAQDDFGSLTKRSNLDIDSDGDGVTNRHDRSDSNPNKW